MQYSDGSNFMFSILGEKSDRVIFGNKPMKEYHTKQIFYKKTKKYRFDSSWGKKNLVLPMIVKN